MSWFLELPGPTQISILALCVSAISLLISLFRLSYEVRLANTQKRSELMIKLQEAIRNLKKVEHALKTTQPKREDCAEMTKSELLDARELIANLETAYTQLKRLGGFMSTAKLQLMIPDIVKVIFAAEDLLDKSTWILKACKNCPAPDTQEAEQPKSIAPPPQRDQAKSADA
jgi:hypothetical protein